MFDRKLSLSLLAASVLISACGGGSKGPAGEAALAAPELAGYATEAPVYLLAAPIPPNTPTWSGGTPAWFEVAPALPPGLSLDVATGTLSGAPLEPWPETEHTVTLTNASGSASAVLRLTVPAPTLTLTSDRPLVRVVTEPDAPEIPEHTSGFGTMLVGPDPDWTPAALAGLAPLAPDAALDLGDGGESAVGAGSALFDATVAFTAQVTASGEHLTHDVAWEAEALAPFESLTATATGASVPSTLLDAAPAASELALVLTDPDGALAPLESNTLPTARFHLRAHAEELGLDDDGTWVIAGDRLVFARVDANGRRKLYAFDPATGTARRALDMLPGADDDTRVLGTFDGRVLFTSINNPLDQAQKLYTYDPVEDALLSLCEIWPHEDEATGRVVERDGALYFAASKWTATRKLFRYAEHEGAAPDVRSVANLSGDTGTTDAPEAALALGDDVYFVAAPLYGGRKLYRLRTDVDAIEQVTDLRGPGADDAIDDVTAAGDRVHFTARTWSGGQKLFQFDPASGALRQLTDLAGSAAADDGVRDLATDGERLFFVAQLATGIEKVFVLDVATGALAVAGHTAGVGHDDAPSDLTPHAAGLWFAARTASGGRKLHLWRADTGVLEAASDVRGDATLDDDPRHLTAFGTRLALSLQVAPGVRKLFLADPAAGWLVQAADVAGPGVDDAPRPRLDANGTLWFTAAAGAETALYSLAEPPAGP